MYYGKVEICGLDTSKLKTLTSEEKRELLLRASGGDGAARDELIFANLRLVLSVIQRFSGSRENMDDLFQVGCIGLLKSIDRFDLDKEVEFSTYAVPMIIGEVRRYLRDNASLRVSRSLRDLAYKALTVREETLRHENREATLDEIAKALGVGVHEVTEAMSSVADPVSLYEPIYNDGADPIYVMDQISDESCSDEAWLENIALKEALSKLTPRERSIIELRYYGGKTQTEIAARIGISQAQVSRLEKSALSQIRKQM
ncbi:MAG: RNA polymerase sporulation sigma factor SigG [Clostridiales bacterium]|nr:RNA polymerase sporulation sigma factor SigG [Clostridiales bacterium]